MYSIKVIELCVSHFKNLIGPKLIVSEDVLKAWQEFYNVVGCVSEYKYLSRVGCWFWRSWGRKCIITPSNGKSPRWDDVTNEVFKNYDCMLKESIHANDSSMLGFWFNA